jgi:hypothetical protein
MRRASRGFRAPASAGDEGLDLESAGAAVAVTVAASGAADEEVGGSEAPLF